MILNGIVCPTIAPEINCELQQSVKKNGGKVDNAYNIYGKS